MSRLIRLSLIVVAVAAVLAAACLAWGYREARAMPVARRVTVTLADWPRGAPAMSVAVIGDIHIGNAAMDPARLARIADHVNAVRPDLVLLAGDFIAGHDPGLATRLAPALTDPLRRLAAPLGVVAVLGNHDHWTGAGAVRDALSAAGVSVLSNAARRYGPLTLVAIDDRHTRRDDIGQAIAAARRLRGPRLVLSHGPDIVPDLPPDAPLVVASHTHCGQIVLPFYGPPVIPSNFGRRYACGVIREPGRATIVGAGVGTSGVPLRIGAPPDLWLVTLRGRGGAR